MVNLSVSTPKLFEKKNYITLHVKVNICFAFNTKLKNICNSSESQRAVMKRRTKVFYLQGTLSFRQSKPSLRHSGSVHSLLHDPSANFSLHFRFTGQWPHGSPDAAVETDAY